MVTHTTNIQGSGLATLLTVLFVGLKTNIQGPGLATLLTVLFVGLKLAGVITWSWVWVLSPLWLGGVLFLTIPLLLMAGMAVSSLIQGYRKGKGA